MFWALYILGTSLLAEGLSVVTGDTTLLCRGVVTALKPVRAEQVSRPEWKQNWTVPHCGSVSPMPKPVGSIHIGCLAAREQTSAAQIAIASPPYNMKYFIHFLALSFNSIFNFFWLKRPSTSARTVVPLTTPLIHELAFFGTLCSLDRFLIIHHISKYFRSLYFPISFHRHKMRPLRSLL